MGDASAGFVSDPSPTRTDRQRGGHHTAGRRGAPNDQALLITAPQRKRIEVATLIPDEWLAASATGSAEQCVAAIRGQLDLGCDGVILHGASPAELEPVVEAWRKARPAGKWDHLAANPAG